MYTSKNYQKADNNTAERKPYQSRIYVMPSYRINKDGDREESTVLISFGNYWFVNHSKNGGIYGRLTITGDYNKQTLKKAFPTIDTTPDRIPITLFLFDSDAKYIDDEGSERVQKSFVARIYETDGGLCAQVLKMF